MTVKINTSRLGVIDILESEWIVIKGSILGFEHLNRFILLNHEENTPLCWLQSIDDPAIAFVVVNPRIIKSDFNPDVFERDLQFLDIKNDNDIALLSIITIRSNPFRMTANLRAPILINAANRMANQIILDNPNYPIQYDILDNKTDVNQCSSDTHNSLCGLNKLPSMTAAV